MFNRRQSLDNGRLISSYFHPSKIRHGGRSKPSVGAQKSHAHPVKRINGLRLQENGSGKPTTLHGKPHGFRFQFSLNQSIDAQEPLWEDLPCPPLPCQVVHLRCSAIQKNRSNKNASFWVWPPTWKLIEDQHPMLGWKVARKDLSHWATNQGVAA